MEPRTPDPTRSAAATAAAVDPHLQNVDAIRLAVRRLREAYQSDPVVDGFAGPEACAHPGLRAVLEQRGAEVRRRRALLAQPSCDLPCPSACCYFEDETFTYGIFLQDGELETLTDHFRIQARDASDFIGCVDHSGPGGPVHYPLTNSLASAVGAPWRPRTLAYGEPAWITSRSKPCMFMESGRCAIHDVGTPPGLSACRAFLCLAALVWLLLKDVGVARASDVEGCSMPELQEFAVSVLPLLEARFWSDHLAAVHREMRDALAHAVRQERAGHTSGVDGDLRRYEAARARAAEAEGAAAALLGQAVAAFSADNRS